MIVKKIVKKYLEENNYGGMCPYYSRPLNLFEVSGCLHLGCSDLCVHPLSEHSYKPCPWFRVDVEPRLDSDDDGEVKR